MKQTENEYIDFDEKESSFDIKKIFFKYLSYWKWFLISFIVFMVIGSIYLMRLTPQYKITASILVKDDKKIGGASEMMLEQFNMFSSNKLVENEIEILKSYTLIEQVVNDLNLGVTYTYKKGLRERELYKNSPIRIEPVNVNDKIFEEKIKITLAEGGQINVNGKEYPQSDIIFGSYGSIRVIVNDSLADLWKGVPVSVSFTSKEVKTEQLRNSINIGTSGKGSSVLQLSMLSPIPQKGKDILDKLIENYNLASIADKNMLARNTLIFIDERLEKLAKELEEEELTVQQYKSSRGITDISAEAQLFLQTAQQNDIEKNKVEIQLSVLQNIEEYVLLNADKDGAAPATPGINDPVLLSLIERLAQAEAERSKALYTMKPANPVILALDEQINGLKQSILDNIHGLRKNLEVTQSKINSENRRIEAMIQSVPQKERELVDITRQKEIKNQLYVYLLSKKEETAISDAATIADSRLIDSARSSLRPVKPVKRNIILVFALLGIVVPVIVIWIIDQLYDKIRSKEEIEKNVLAPFLGDISYLEQSSKIVMTKKSKGRVPEQIRTLRTNIEFMNAGGVHSILITSSISGEGKSFLTANLGAAFASLGKKTIILGFDLRKPGLHKVFGIENEDGLSNYLIGQKTLAEVTHKIEDIDNLYLISCGVVPPNPQELLQGESLSKLFEELKKQYDYIIIDTPPIGLVSDAQILSHYADASIFVMRQEYTPKDRIKFVNDLYRQGKVSNLGIVVNGVKDERWYGYYSSYGSEKYYGKYYLDE